MGCSLMGRDALQDRSGVRNSAQIPIEVAVPTLCRAPQSIIVGDAGQYCAKQLETDNIASRLWQYNAITLGPSNRPLDQLCGARLNHRDRRLQSGRVGV